MNKNNGCALWILSISFFIIGCVLIAANTFISAGVILIIGAIAIPLSGYLLKKKKEKEELERETELARKKQEKEKEENRSAVEKYPSDYNYYVSLLELKRKLPLAYFFGERIIMQEDMTDIDIFIHACDDYLSALSQRDKFRNLANVIKKESQKDGAVCYKNELLGLYSDSDTSNNFSKCFERETSNIQSLKEKCEQIQRKTLSFEKSLNNLATVAIQIDLDNAATQKTLADMPEFHIMNLTSRTPESITDDFIVIDVETTGLKPSVSEIVQVSAIRFEGGHPVESFATLVKPKKGIKEEARRINGISEEMVAQAPYIESIIGSFDSFIGKTLPVIGHNVLFDIKFLYTNGSESLTPKRRYYDTCALSKKIYERSSYRLEDILNDEMSIYRKDAHNALSDCLATGKLFREICYKIQQNS